jgi:hypothetical protein
VRSHFASVSLLDSVFHRLVAKYYRGERDGGTSSCWALHLGRIDPGGVWGDSTGMRDGTGTGRLQRCQAGSLFSMPSHLVLSGVSGTWRDVVTSLPYALPADRGPATIPAGSTRRRSAGAMGHPAPISRAGFPSPPPLAYFV